MISKTNVKNLLTLVVVGAFLTSCASQSTGEVSDPLEGMNRGIFKFNNAIDTAVLEPVAKGYRNVVPKPARTGVRNVLHNLKSPTIIANDLLQGNVTAAGNDLTRFFANTLLGLGGLIDVAGAENVKYKEEDFGQTLAVWGVGNGPYLMLPLFGSSTLRDTTGMVVDAYTDPLNLWMRNTDRDGLYYGRIAVASIDKREELLDVLSDLKRNSVDYYAAVRSTYAQRRDALVHDRAQADQKFEDIP